MSLLTRGLSKFIILLLRTRTLIVIIIIIIISASKKVYYINLLILFIVEILYRFKGSYIKSQFSAMLVWKDRVADIPTSSGCFKFHKVFTSAWF